MVILYIRGNSNRLQESVTPETDPEQYSRSPLHIRFHWQAQGSSAPPCFGIIDHLRSFEEVMQANQMSSLRTADPGCSVRHDLRITAPWASG